MQSTWGWSSYYFICTISSLSWGFRFFFCFWVTLMKFRLTSHMDHIIKVYGFSFLWVDFQQLFMYSSLVKTLFDWRDHFSILCPRAFHVSFPQGRRSVFWVRKTSGGFPFQTCKLALRVMMDFRKPKFIQELGISLFAISGSFSFKVWFLQALYIASLMTSSTESIDRFEWKEGRNLVPWFN